MATNTNPFYTYSATAGSSKTLQKPQDGGDNNQWGTYINTDLDEIVAAVNALSDKIADANEKTLVDFTATGSAVNHVGITNAATGNPPQISSAGSDTNVDLTLTAKGTGDINLTPGTNGDVNIPASKGITFGDDGEKIEGDGTDLTIASSATLNVNTGSASGNDLKVNTSQLVVEGDTGNVLVGKTSADTYNSVNGIELQSSGLLTATRAGIPQILNREDSDGEIAVFRKDGTTVGTIGVRASDNLYINCPQNGIEFTNTDMRPIDGNGDRTDGVSDIGDSANRFKDLYLSGGVYLGGTSSINHLDYYEEGNITGSDFKVNGTSITNLDSGNSKYTKVGNLVNVSVYMNDGTVTLPDTGEFTMDLPFNAVSYRSSISPVIMYITTGTWGSDVTYPTGMVVTLYTSSTLAFFPTENLNNRLDVTATGTGQMLLSFSITYLST